MYKDIDVIQKYINAADYLTVAQIFLKDNFFLERKLKYGDLKKNLKGHWGTSPGVNFIYAHLINFSKKHEAKCSLVVGTGHAAEALLSNLFLDGTLELYYGLKRNRSGIESLISIQERFKIRSEINPQFPGTLYDGSELGYSLSFAQGSVMGDKEKIVFCIVGDGEAETGTISAAWQAQKLLNLSYDGQVIPILNLNGFKMGNPSLFSSMTDMEILNFFQALRYDVKIIHYDHKEMISALDWAFECVKKQRNPVIVFCSLKGQVQGFDGASDIMGQYSHKVPLKEALAKQENIDILERWLISYKPGDIFEDRKISDEVLNFTKESCLGKNILYDVKDDRKDNYTLAEEDMNILCENSTYNVECLDKYIEKLLYEDDNFMVFSPDELGSNRFFRLDKLKESSDRIKEILNENICMSWLQGHIQSGGNGILISYEAFAPIVDSMVSQYCKFLYQSKKINWRGKKSSLNFFLTSLWWTNVYSHQNPGFVDNLLMQSWDFVQCYFPIDKATLLLCSEESFKSYNKVNIVVCSKNENNFFLNFHEAKEAVELGYYDWNTQNSYPNLVICTIGESSLAEGKKAIKIFKKTMVNISVKLISVISFKVFDDEKLVKKLFSLNPVIFVYHGYKTTIKSMIFGKIDNEKVRILGFENRSDISGNTLEKLSSNHLSNADIVNNMYELIGVDNLNNKYGSDIN